jgi:hypothetical protein
MNMYAQHIYHERVAFVRLVFLIRVGMLKKGGR